MLTARQLECLSIMIDEDEELVADGVNVWVGGHLFRRSTMIALLRCCAISDVSDVKGLERFVVNGTGRAIRTNPELAEDVYDMVRQQKPFTISNGLIMPI